LGTLGLWNIGFLKMKHKIPAKKQNPKIWVPKKIGSGPGNPELQHSEHKKSARGGA
jgi:hypothetical protein